MDFNELVNNLTTNQFQELEMAIYKRKKKEDLAWAINMVKAGEYGACGLPTIQAIKETRTELGCTVSQAKTLIDIEDYSVEGILQMLEKEGIKVTFQEYDPGSLRNHTISRGLAIHYGLPEQVQVTSKGELGFYYF